MDELSQPTLIPQVADRRPPLRHPGWLAALFAFSILLGSFGLNTGADFSTTDAWVAQTAREMQQRDEWIVPWFAGELRLQKSPGPYWAVMLTSMVRGEPIDEVSARIPNVINAVLFVLCVYWLALRIAGERAANFAGFACVSSMMFFMWSHRAASDLGVASFSALSLACLWVAYNRYEPGRRQVLLVLSAYLLAGIAMLYKGPMPLAAVGLPAVLYLLFTRRFKILKSGWHLVGLVLFCLPWLPWVIAILQVEPAAVDKWKLQFLDRFTGELPLVAQQYKAIYYLTYVGAAAAFALPYTLSIPAAIYRAFRKPAHVDRDGMNFMLIWLISLVVFLHVSAGKESRYFLIAMPPLFVMLGVELAHFFDPARIIKPIHEKLLGWVVWIFLPVGLIAGVFALRKWQQSQLIYEWSAVWQPYVVFAVILGFGGCLSAWWFRFRSRNGAFAVLVGTMWLTWLWMWPMMMPMLGNEAEARSFAEQVREKVPPERLDDLRSIGVQDSRVIWYGDLRMPRLIDPIEILEMQGGKRSLQRELELYGQYMINALADKKPTLMVVNRMHYALFLEVAPARLAAEGREMPEHHLWIQPLVGKRRDKHQLLFAAEPPPWPEPTLNPPSRSRKEAGIATAGGGGLLQMDDIAEEAVTPEDGAEPEDVAEPVNNNAPEDPTETGDAVASTSTNGERAVEIAADEDTELADDASTSGVDTP